MSDDKFSWGDDGDVVLIPADPLDVLQAEIDRLDEILRTAVIVGGPDDFQDGFNPNQSRDSNGRWTSGGGGGGSGSGGGFVVAGPMESDPSTRGSIELRRSLDNGTATMETIMADPSFQAAHREMRAQPLTTNLPDYGSEEFFTNRRYGKHGEIVGREAATEFLFADSAVLAYGGDKEKALPVVQGRQATIFTGAPAAGKSTVADPYAREMRARIIDSDEAKKLIPGYRNGIGANAVHEESGDIIDEVYNRAKANGDNMVIPKVGHNAKAIDRLVRELQDAGYDVKVVFVDTDPNVAWRRMASRWIATGRLIPPDYMQTAAVLPAIAFQETKASGSANSYAHIDNNPGIGQPRKIISGSVIGIN